MLEFLGGVSSPQNLPTLQPSRATSAARQVGSSLLMVSGRATFSWGGRSLISKVYRPWIDERFEPRRFSQLQSKMGNTVKYAIGAFIQALGQNPGLEPLLRNLVLRPMFMSVPVWAISRCSTNSPCAITAPREVESVLVPGRAPQRTRGLPTCRRRGERSGYVSGWGARGPSTASIHGARPTKS